jgi:sulfonate transport system substrate-binding protein
MKSGSVTRRPVAVIARQQAVLEKRFVGKQLASSGSSSSGPPLLEAMSIGSVDLGARRYAADLQAANANIVYVAGSRITNGQGVLVPGTQHLTIADLKGKRIGFTKGEQRAQRGDRHAGEGRPDL